MLGSVPTTGRGTVFTFDAPLGAFLVRVHAIGESGRSLASNEIPLVVSGARPSRHLQHPPRPRPRPGHDARALLDVDPHGGDPARLWLQVSGSLSGVLPVPAGESFRFDGVPPGTYTFSLVAENDVGPSAPSNPVTLTFPGTCTGAGPTYGLPVVAGRGKAVGRVESATKWRGGRSRTPCT